ncbi:hypothetical protein GW17_00008890 [Ensete ventricosum]|nr:hypothetical protein GW17_00008890 [Ensete ventricosum]
MALIDRVHDAGQVISCMGDKITDLRSEVPELKEGPGLAAVREAEEALNVELQRVPEKAKEVIAEYKESSSFKLGLQRSGQVSYEYRYWVS